MQYEASAPPASCTLQYEAGPGSSAPPLSLPAPVLAEGTLEYAAAECSLEAEAEAMAEAAVAPSAAEAHAQAQAEAQAALTCAVGAEAAGQSLEMAYEPVPSSSSSLQQQPLQGAAEEELAAALPAPGPAGSAAAAPLRRACSVWRLQRPSEQCSFPDSAFQLGNVQLLWLALPPPLLSLLQHGAAVPDSEALLEALPSAALSRGAKGLLFYSCAAAALAALQSQSQSSSSSSSPKLLVLCEVACGREHEVPAGAFFSGPKLGRSCTLLQGAAPERSADAPWPFPAPPQLQEQGQEQGQMQEEGEEELGLEPLPPCIAHYGSCAPAASAEGSSEDCWEARVIPDANQVRLRYLLQCE